MREFGSRWLSGPATNDAGDPRSPDKAAPAGRFCFSDPSRSTCARDLVLLSLSAAAGMLTHYHFAIALAGAGVLVAIRCYRHKPRQIGIFAGCVAAGGLVFWSAHPEFLHSFGQQVRQLQPFTVADLLERICQDTRYVSGLLRLALLVVAEIGRILERHCRG